MNLTFQPVLATDEELLIDWLSSDTWPYHCYPTPTREKVQEWFANGMFTGEGNRTFFVILNDKERVGMIRLSELFDPTPIFDLRIQSPYRGKGIGKKALLWLTDYIFTSMPEKIRIEGQTRQDNIAMRQLFRQCGYIKEAHYRKAWPTKEGIYLDSIGYGILREDWKRKKITPVNWNDEDFESDDCV